jgi:hypothetical protein
MIINDVQCSEPSSYPDLTMGLSIPSWNLVNLVNKIEPSSLKSRFLVFPGTQSSLQQQKRCGYRLHTSSCVMSLALNASGIKDSS